MTDTPIPRATYRLQFHAGFRFADAAAIAPYLARLGVSHVYASPWMKARPGSGHGYDIVDHGALNPELGTAEDFRAMCAAFRANGLGQVLDIVPNHMGVGGADNPWWLDVLEWGEASDFAGWFDIDWDPDRRYLTGKLLVPFLGAQYGAVLEAGDLRLRYDEAAGSFAVWAYGTHKLPVCPLHYPRILGDAHPVLERLGDAFAGLPESRPHVARHARDLQAELAATVRADDRVAAALDAAVARFSGEVGDLSSWAALDALIADQHWRAAHFRVAADDINYRRFFNINELAGIRMELPEVFDHAHRLPFALLADGTLDGLRIDHVDGLLDPKGYLQRLRERAPRRFWLVVEKILARHEQPREDWPVDGTTGYEFANLLLGVLLDPGGEDGMTRALADFAGPPAPFADLVRDCKLGILRDEMASELNVLARDAGRLARQHPRTADITRNLLGRALSAVIACFPVYRSYPDEGGVASDADRRDIDWAVAQARRVEPTLDPGVFDFLHRVLTGDLVVRPRSGYSRHAALRLARRVQQLSGPVMAKGLEDTAFYRWPRLLALNEVGGHPDAFGISVAAFHAANARRARHWPAAMLATSTHDTKRGEDVRARLAVLAEMPEEWARRVRAWSRLLRARRGDLEGTAPPAREDEYSIWQLVVGAWPAELCGGGAPGADPLRAYAARLEGAVRKSLREAKLRSSWVAPDLAYEEAALGFVRDALDAEASPALLDSLVPFARHVARLGAANGLVQAAVKLTAPGVPDIYQGAELWELSLVDPDNRRPVDFARRAALLDQVRAALAGGPDGALRGMLEAWHDGRVKLALTAALLEHRRAQPRLFAEGTYLPLPASGAQADRVLAFARCESAEALILVATRFPTRGALPPGTAIPWPEAASGVARWRELMTGAVLERRGGQLDLGELPGPLPVAILIPDTPARV